MDNSNSSEQRQSFKPRLRTLENSTHERRASWLELFFDLVIVVAIAQLAHLLEEHPDSERFMLVALLFAATFLGWQGFSFYADRFDTDDLIFRIAGFAQMLLFLIIASQMEHVVEGEHKGFALAFAALRFILVVQYFSVYRYIKVARQLALRYGGAYAISVVLWVISAFVPSPYFLILWLAALLLDFSQPWTAIHLHRTVPTDPQHVPERFGLFTLIVMGELVVAAGLGISALDLTNQEILIAFAGFLMVIGVWWLYFDPLSGREFEHDKPLRVVTFAYSHLPLLGGLVFAAGGITILISHPSEVNIAGYLALCGGLTVFLLSLTLADAQLLHTIRHEIILARFVGIVILILLVILQPSSVVTALISAVSMLGLAAFETTFMRYSKEAISSP